jgi:hypothetical protein
VAIRGSRGRAGAAGVLPVALQQGNRWRRGSGSSARPGGVSTVGRAVVVAAVHERIYDGPESSLDGEIVYPPSAGDK